MKIKLLKIFVAVLFVQAAVFALAFTACGKSGENSSGGEAASVTVTLTKSPDGSYGITVPYSVQTIDLSQYVQVSGGATYVISYDNGGTNVVSELSLSYGDNVFYIVSSSSAYAITVTRLQPVTVTFFSDNETEFSTRTVSKGDKVTAPDGTPEKTGCEFKGWDYNFDLPVTQDINVYADFDVIEYSISYNLQDGDFETTAQVLDTYTYFSDDYEVPTPIKTGYIFVGWTTDYVMLPQASYTVAIGSEGSINLTANWTPKQYAVTYSVNGDLSAIPGGTFIFGESVGMLPVPGEGSDDVFDGWIFTDDNGDHKIENGSIWNYDAASVYLVADYANCWHVTFINGTGSVFVNVKVKQGSPVAEPAQDPEREHAYFRYWKHSGEEYNFALPVTGDITLDPVFGNVEYGIEYDLDGGRFTDGNEGKETYTYYDSDYTLTAPYRTGYNFIGWTGNGITEPQITMVLASGSYSAKTFTAHWQTKTFNVSYIAEGSEISTGTVTYGSAIGTLPEYTPNGNGIYTGFCYEYEGVPYPVNAETVWLYDSDSSDIVITATYKTKIKFALNGGNIGGNTDDITTTLEYGQYVPVETPYKHGYEFCGWFINYAGRNIYYYDGFEITSEALGTAEYDQGGDQLIINAVYVIEPFGEPFTVTFKHSSVDALNYESVKVYENFAFELPVAVRTDGDTDAAFVGFTIQGDATERYVTDSDAIWDYIDETGYTGKEITLVAKWLSGYTN